MTEAGLLELSPMFAIILTMFGMGFLFYVLCPK